MKKEFWHSQSADACLKKLETDLQGLAFSEAENRRKLYGENEIKIRKKRNVLRKLMNQFHNILIYILIIAAIVTALLQHWIDAGVIVGVVFLNALIGYIQESKAEKSIEALKALLSLQANIVREGKRARVAANELVPGDIVLLSSGDKVPADLRLLKANNLQIDEAMLTGESLPVSKNTQMVAKKSGLFERTSMAYSGAMVTRGVGVGVVVATGEKTEVGRISAMLAGLPRLSTPLLRQIAIFGRWLALLILSFSFVVFLFGVFVRHYPVEDMFMAAVAIAVSIIPEGLPAIISIALAIGVVRMARRNAIIRRLASVETLSSVDVICTDKTGTLTKNELTVQKIILPNAEYSVTGSGYNDDGKLIWNDKAIDVEKEPDLSLLIKAGVLCNDSRLNKQNNIWRLFGNPTDGALLTLGLKAKLSYDKEIICYPKVAEIPFDSQYKCMASLHRDKKNRSFIFLKGAPEQTLAKCSYQLQDQTNVALDKNYWQKQIDQLAQQGMRVLALACREMSGEPRELSLKDIEHDLIFIGIVGIIDPPRKEVPEAVLSCQQAGIRVKIITGDHRLTARAIAKQVGILSPHVLDGENIDAMNDQQLAAVIDDVDIYARTIPEHKLRLIQALRAKNHIVAMTGDGVNDAPALKSTDIGISMGIKGTDVAKEASEIILLDDNFASIKEAIKEARNIYANLKKAILFILPTSGGIGLSVFIAILFGYTLPITPVQILWVNMITTVTLALALGFEPAEKGLMKQKPRNPKESLLSKFLLWRIAFVSFLFLCSMFGLFIYEIKQQVGVSLARTVVVDTLVLLEAVYLINCRRFYHSVISWEGLFGSKPSLIAIGLVVSLQLGFTYLPFMQYAFKTQALGLLQWVIILIVVLVVFFIIEFEKIVIRRFLSK